MHGGQQPQALYLPNQSFTVIKGVKVWTDFKGKLLDLKEAGGLLPSVGDLTEDDLFDEVNTRQAMFVPSELAPLFLEESLTPKFLHPCRCHVARGRSRVQRPYHPLPYITTCHFCRIRIPPAEEQCLG
jgi:hypothetical protein